MNVKRVMQWVVSVLLLSTITLDYDRGFTLNAAYAQDSGALTISWTPPVQYTDGAPLLEQELDFYTFYCNGVSIKVIDSVIGTSTDIVDTTGLVSGDYTCRLTTTTLLAAESGPSNSINFTIGPRVPMAPANLTSS